MSDSQAMENGVGTGVGEGTGDAVGVGETPVLSVAAAVSDGGSVDGTNDCEQAVQSTANVRRKQTSRIRF